MEKPPGKLLGAVGAALVVAGWIVLFLGWQRAGQQELETGQIPFIISGGFGGWALILLGLGALVADVVQRAAYLGRVKADELRTAIEELSANLEERLSAVPDPDVASGDGDGSPPTRRRSTRGSRSRRSKTA